MRRLKTKVVCCSMLNCGYYYYIPMFISFFLFFLPYFHSMHSLGRNPKLDQGTWLCQIHLDYFVDKIHATLDHIRPYYTILDLIGPLWSIFDHFDKYWTILDNVGPFWDYFEKLFITLKLFFYYFGLFWSILIHFRLYCIRIRTRRGIYGQI